MAEPNPPCPDCGRSSLRFYQKAGEYRCIEEDCGGIYRPEDLAHGASPATVTAATDGIDLDRLPFPVAYPLYHARDTRLTSGDRVANALFAGYQAMRTTALLLLADYLACDTVSRQLQGPIRNLRQPHWNEWSLLCDALAKFWSGRLQDAPEREGHFPALVTAWFEVNRRKKLPARHPHHSLLQDLPGLQGAAVSLNDALWKARNDRAHREATRTVADDQERARLPRLLALAERLAVTLFPPDSLTLWRRVPNANQHGQAIRLQGPHPDLRFVLEAGPDLLTTDDAASDLLACTADADLPIFPLFVAFDAEGDARSVPGGGLIEPLGLIDGINERQVAVLGVRGYCERPDLAAPMQVALARKAVQLGNDRSQTKRWSLVSWAAVTAGDTLNQLHGRKYFPEVYLERAGIDTLVDQVLAQPGRALLLLGEAGAGKSSLLARLVDRLLNAEQQDESGDALGYLARRESGDLVLFLSGAEAYRGDGAWSGRQTLCEAVLRRAGIRSGEFTDLTDLCAHLDATAAQDQDAERRVWLVFDALNEAERFTDLLKALDDLLAAVARYPWLRLVVSLRTGAYQSLAQRHRTLLQHGEEVFANARYLAEFTDARGEAVPYLALRPFTDAEAAAAYALRQQRLPEQSCPAPLARLEPTVRELLRAPLYLHLFHLTFPDHRAPPGDLDQGRLLGAYLERLQADLPGLGGYLRRLGELMVAQRIPWLPSDTAEEWVDEWRQRLGVDNALRAVKLDPVEELVSASLLMRPTEAGEGAARRLIGYGFAQQRLCEQVLLRELQRQIAPRALPTGAELLAWARHAAGATVDAEDATVFDELTAALEQLAADLAQAGQGAALAELLALENKSVRTRLLGAALKALGALSRDQPDAGVPVLDPLLELGLSDGLLRKRLAESSWQAARWLEKHGFGIVAKQIWTGFLTILRALVAQEPGRADLRRDLSVVLGNLGGLAEAAGDGARARQCYEEALEILRALVAQEPGSADLRRDLSVSLSNLGRLAQAAGDGARARQYFEESFEIMRALVAQVVPGRAYWHRDLSVSLNNLGRLAEVGGDGGLAHQYFEESLAIMRALVAQEPGRADLRRELGESLNNLGRLAQAAGDGARARQYFKESLEIMRALVVQEPRRADLRRDLSASLNNLGGLAEVGGDGGLARQYFEESLAIMRALVAEEPQRANLRINLAISYWNQYFIAARADKRQWLEQVLDTLRPLREAGFQHAQLEQLWSLATEALESQTE